MGSEQTKRVGATGRTDMFDIPPENLYSPRSDPTHDEHADWLARTDPTTPTMMALLDSMRLNGTDEGEPVIYTRTPAKRNEIADGDRRHAACLIVNAERKATKPKGVMLVLRCVPTKDPVLARNLGNACRQDDPPMLLARRYRAAFPSMGKPAAAASLGLRLDYAGDLLACLSLPVEIQARVNAGELPPDQARRIGKAADPVAVVAKATVNGKVDPAKAKAAARDAVPARSYRLRPAQVAALVTNLGQAKRSYDDADTARYSDIMDRGEALYTAAQVAAIVRRVAGEQGALAGDAELEALLGADDAKGKVQA